MIYNTPVSPNYLFEQIPQSPGENPPAPRCSLNFVISTDDGSIMNDTELRLQNFDGQESLSQLFEFNLELRANDYTSGGRPVGSSQNYGDILNPTTPTTKKMDFDNIIGASATIMLGTPETIKDQNSAKYPEERPVVFFNGIVTNFALADRGVYHATLKPALFKLGLQNNYRLFSQCTILQVVTQVLTENNICFNKADLVKEPNNIVMGLANYRTQDWLQAGESDLDFINRLMQKVNLFYYFVHTKSSHIMTITDQPFYQSIYQRAIDKEGNNAETDQIKSLYLSYTQQASLDRDDMITQFKYQQNMTTAGITTVLAQKQATWESQNTAQVSPVYLNSTHQKEKLNMEQLHLVQYGATETEIGKLTDTAVNQLAAAKFDFSGASSCTELKAGHKFQIEETWQDSDASAQPTINQFTSQLPIRPLLDKRFFVATSVKHQASAAGDYKNQFNAVAAEGLATPFRAHGNQQGNILALVTDKPKPIKKKPFFSAIDFITSSVIKAIESVKKDDKDAIIHHGTSAKYLKKNVFSFDSKDFQYEKSENKYSCRGVYVRFIDQPDTALGKWVKLAEHMQTIPEIGSYVVIGRSSDDNEIPEIQQSLEAKGSKVIMPKGFTCHTNVGNSYNTNYGDSTSISFGSDINTPLETARKIVDKQRASDNYNDVRYGESSSYGYNVSKRSHNISTTGSGENPDFNPSVLMNYVSYGHSKTYGDTYNESNHEGNSSNVSTQLGSSTSTSSLTGATTSESNTNGAQTNATKLNGVSSSVYVGIGAETSVSSRTGIITNISNINGQQINGSVILGNAISTSSTTGNTTNSTVLAGNVTNTQTTTGNSTNTTIMTGNSTNTQTTTGNSTNTQTTTGNSTNTTIMTGNSTNTQTTTGNVTNTTIVTGNTTNSQTTTGDSTNITTTTGNATNIETITGNITENKTFTGVHTINGVDQNRNEVITISSGTTTVTDSSITTKTIAQRTEMISGTVTML